MLWNAIGQLPKKFQELFELSFEQGMKNAEIANLLNISESAVKKRKAQFITLLRQHFSQKTNDEIRLILIVSLKLLNL